MEEQFNDFKKQVQKLYDIDFYKKKFDKAGINPSDIKTVNDFKRIPFTKSSVV